VPRDPSLDGQQTTSLCGPRAEDEFRVAVVDTSTTPLLGVMLVTDGYGNAQVADPWTDAVSADLAQLINDRPPEWLAGQLPLWASRCASADGSADDTTIALLIAPSATGWRHDVPDESAADEATTAARRLAEPTTQPSLRGPGRATADRSRRLMVIGAAALVIAAVAAFLAIQLSSSPGTAPIPGTKPTSCSSPSATAGQHAKASATAAAGPHIGAVSNPCKGGKAGG
jgi:hypothetical protein